MAVTRHYPRGTVILNVDDHSDSLYIILSGEVKIYLSDDEGKEVILNVQGTGEYFGEMALIDSGPRSASVITTEKTSLYVISKPDLEAFLETHPAVTLKIMRGLVKRLRALTESVRSLALLDVYGRVARLLLQLAEPADGTLVIRQALTHREIASRIGASREMVTRIMNDLKTGGYIQVEQKHITIKERLPHHW